MAVDDLLAAPFLLVGSDDEILTAIRQRQQRWGINRLVIRKDAIDKLAPLLPRLHETTEYCLTTAVTVDSLFDACEVIRAAVDIAGPHANDHLRLRATARPSGTHAGDTWQISSDYAGR